MQRLYEVIGWGNDVDGGNGPDTSYLVLAPDHAVAAGLVEVRRGRADVIHELGVSAGVAPAPSCVLRGPYIESAYNQGHFPFWEWDELLRTWYCTPSREDGLAQATYPDGTPAASARYAKRQRHGVIERWYPDGTPLSREWYVNDRVVDVHEWWYATGVLARRHEYVYPTRHALQRTATTWDEYGEIIEQVTSS